MSGAHPGFVANDHLDVVQMLDRFEDVATFLDSLVRWAVEQSPGAEACGLTLEQAGRGLTVTYSGELAARGDERQYELDDGPCLEALRTRSVVRVRDLAEEDRWGDYPRRAMEAGVRSSLSFPLVLGEGARGALNLYSGRPDAFNDTDERAGHSWAGQAAGALSVAWRMAERERGGRAPAPGHAHASGGRAGRRSADGPAPVHGRGGIPAAAECQPAQQREAARRGAPDDRRARGRRALLALTSRTTSGIPDTSRSSPLGGDRRGGVRCRYGDRSRSRRRRTGASRRRGPRGPRRVRGPAGRRRPRRDRRTAATSSTRWPGTTSRTTASPPASARWRPGTSRPSGGPSCSAA